MENKSVSQKSGLQATLFGDPEATTFEHRIFNAVMLLSAVTALTSLLCDISFGALRIQICIDLIATIIALLVYCFSRKIRKYEILAIPTIVIFLAVVVLSWFTYQGLNGGAPYYFFILLVSSGAVLKKPYKYVSMAIIVLIVASLLLIENLSPGLYLKMKYTQRVIDVSTSYFLCLVIVAFMMNIVLSEHYKDREKLKNAFEEIKTLKKFLPICARCKKIRDDKGYWSQIEEYFSAHSDIEFSHGLCPDCFDKTMKESKLGE